VGQSLVVDVFHIPRSAGKFERSFDLYIETDGKLLIETFEYQGAAVEAPSKIEIE